MKVLVTGSNGFVGKNLCAVLRRRDEKGKGAREKGEERSYLLSVIRYLLSVIRYLFTGKEKSRISRKGAKAQR